MKPKVEKLGDKASVKGTMLQAHLEWVERQTPGISVKLGGLSEQARGLATGKLLVTEWIPFRLLIEIDRAIAQAMGGRADEVYRKLGHHSASSNLAGVYKSYVADEPHKFFERGARLHDRFQNFGRADYEKTGDRTGRITIKDYFEYSPVFCASGVGYYEGALEFMKVPGPIRVLETHCQCAGDPACVFEMSW